MNPVWKAFVRVHTWLLRKTGGKRFTGGANILILRTIGAKSGKLRSNPLMYVPHEDSYAVVASYAGNDKNPGWYYNLIKNSDVDIEVDGVSRPVRARVVDGEERDRLYRQFEAMDKRFTRYQAKTERTIPMFMLAPREQA